MVLHDWIILTHLLLFRICLNFLCFRLQYVQYGVFLGLCMNFPRIETEWLSWKCCFPLGLAWSLAAEHPPPPRGVGGAICNLQFRWCIGTSGGLHNSWMFKSWHCRLNRTFPFFLQISIAFPDDGAWKRFHKQLQHYPTVIFFILIMSSIQFLLLLFMLAMLSIMYVLCPILWRLFI